MCKITETPWNWENSCASIYRQIQCLSISFSDCLSTCLTSVLPREAQIFQPDRSHAHAYSKGARAHTPRRCLPCWLATSSHQVRGDGACGLQHGRVAGRSPDCWPEGPSVLSPMASPAASLALTWSLLPWPCEPQAYRDTFSYHLHLRLHDITQ